MQNTDITARAPAGRTQSDSPANAGPRTGRARLPLLAAFAMAAAVLVQGCFAVIAGTGAGAAVAHSMGRLDAVVSADLGRSEKATDGALAQLQFSKISEKSDALDSVFIARTSEDRRVRIELSKEGDQVTRVWIRVGVFGDEGVSLAVLEKIKANLGT